MAVKVLTLFDDIELSDLQTKKQASVDSSTVPTSLPPIFDNWQGLKRYYAIGEVAGLFSLRSSAIRHWCKEFDLNIKTNSRKDRQFTVANIEALKHIYTLLQVEGYTIEGARRKLKTGFMQTKESQNVLSMHLLHLRNKLLEIRAALV